MSLSWAKSSGSTEAGASGGIKRAVKSAMSVVCAASLLMSAAACGSTQSSGGSVPAASTASAAAQTGDYSSIMNSSVGDVVTFGDYEWYVFIMKDNVCALFCKDTVAQMQYHNEETEVDWADSSLRAWLNGEFYNKFEASPLAVGKNSGYLPGSLMSSPPQRNSTSEIRLSMFLKP